MNKVSWSDVEAGLRERRSPPPVPDAGAFAEDFKARARLVRQEGPGKVAAQWLAPMRWAAATLAVVLVLAVTVLFWPVHEALMTQVKSLNVLAPHSGVIIMNDEGGQGTVVWITDMDMERGGKG